ncbi:SPOR domain-containing protein [Marinicella sp. W31]|uniref:SPOR domain-containing protein n=1 Tax=Marinicella sp. W31 TaxID=3023713 RepID=UPI003757B486
MRRIIIIVYMTCLSLQAQSQSRTSEETGPTAETEIVCYAAAGKWICASKSEQAAARQQATTVNQQQKQAEEAEADAVQITTVPPIPSFENVDDNEPSKAAVTESSDTATAQVTQEREPAAQPTAQKEQLIEESQPTVTSQTTQNTTNRQTPPSTVNQDSTEDTLEQWLQDYPNDWTVQVIGLSNVQNLDQFFNQYGLNRNDYMIVETVVEAGPWWIVILEHFPNRDAAVAAKSRLPSQLADKAWVRPINGIPLP